MAGDGRGFNITRWTCQILIQAQIRSLVGAKAIFPFRRGQLRSFFCLKRAKAKFQELNACEARPIQAPQASCNFTRRFIFFPIREVASEHVQYEDFLRNGLELWGHRFTFNDPTPSRSSQLNETHSLNFANVLCGFHHTFLLTLFP
jgi:hypothetical protein